MDMHWAVFVFVLAMNFISFLESCKVVTIGVVIDHHVNYDASVYLY